VSFHWSSDRSHARRPHHPHLTGSRAAARQIKPASVVRLMPRPQDASRIEIMAWRFYAAIGMAILTRHWHAIISSKRGVVAKLVLPQDYRSWHMFTCVSEYFRGALRHFVARNVGRSVGLPSLPAECNKIFVKHLRAKKNLRNCTHGNPRASASADQHITTARI